LAVNADDRAAVVALGLMGHPDDVELLESLWGTAGRRMRLTLCKAMGLHGSAIFLGRLRTCLTVMDVDPGHGFALRVASSMALGRLGYTVSTRLLIGALTTEALEYEGSPGAGLGVQHSVRAHILAALGEIQSAPEVVETYLGNLHGNAQGGFYLTAMDALWKHGNEQPMYSLMAQSEVVAANALGVIRALSGPEAVSGWLDDERPMVARVAKGQSV